MTDDRFRIMLPRKEVTVRLNSKFSKCIAGKLKSEENDLATAFLDAARSCAKEIPEAEKPSIIREWIEAFKNFFKERE